MTKGQWLIVVDRVTGVATTELWDDDDTAWTAALDIERADRTKFATVVKQLLPQGDS